MEWPEHGGQPEKIKSMFQLEQDTGLYDFSANLNPLGPPPRLKQVMETTLSYCEVYPDPEYREARETLAGHEGVSPAEVLVTNGGAEAIFLVAKQFEGGKAIIVHPTFSEYERACNHYHIETEAIFLDGMLRIPLDELVGKLSGTDVLFLCRPNNPTGTVELQYSLKELLNHARDVDTTVVIDEAFIHFLPEEESLAKWICEYPNLVLLRSLTKIFTIPGIRIGYVLAQSGIITSLQTYQMPWSVNGIAVSILPYLLQQTDFIEETRRWLADQQNRIEWILAELQYEHSPLTTNFYLLKEPRIDEFYHFLIKNGVLPRHTHNFKGLDGEYLRFAVRSHEENSHLFDVLKRWRNRR